MRFLIKLVIFAALIWCGLWGLQSYAAQKMIGRWVQDRTAEGWTVTLDTAQGKVPSRVTTQIALADVTNPVTGNVLRAQGAVVKTQVLWPGNVDVVLPSTPITFGTARTPTTFTATDGIATLRTRPGLKAELRQMALTTAGWSLGAEGDEVLSGAALVASAVQTAKGSPRYDIVLTADGLTPSPALRQMLGLPVALPAQFKSATATGAVVFDGPLNRLSSQGTPPQFTQIILDGAQIDWGGIALRAMGALDVDARGVPSGSLDMQAKDWRNLLDLAQSTGLLPQERRGQAELMFGLLAARGGSADDLDLKLEFRGGGMSLSGLPLGPAPNFTLRRQRQ